MKLTLLKNKRFWKWSLLSVILLPIILFSIAIGIVYAKQDLIVQEMLKTVNADFVGTLKIRDSHIAPFANLPYVSVDLEDLEIYEGKDSYGKNRIAHVVRTYIGFSLLDMLSGKIEIKSIKLSRGNLRIFQYKGGSFLI